MDRSETVNKIFSKKHINQTFYTHKFFLYFGIFYISRTNTRNKQNQKFFISQTHTAHSIIFFIFLLKCKKSNTFFISWKDMVLSIKESSSLYQLLHFRIIFSILNQYLLFIFLRDSISLTSSFQRFLFLFFRKISIIPKHFFIFFFFRKILIHS